MHIIIDGYNLIRQSDTLRRYERFSLDEGRKALINSISQYRKQKGHAVTIVFDGWEGGSAEEERDRISGIEIIYSRRGEKADDVIKRMVEKKEVETLVVTSDRNIADFVNNRGGTAVSSREFEELISMVKTGSPERQSYTEGLHDKDDGDKIKEGAKKKGPSRRLSRKKKMALARIRKL
jgi:predicted RNA-binding protein with PIN domain